MEVNSMNLLLMSKNKRKKLKVPKTKLVQKNAYMRLLEANG